MEALAAVALTGNVCQFVEYLIKAIRLVREVHESASGVRGENAELENILKDLRKCSDPFSRFAGRFTGPDADALRGIAEKGDQILAEILEALEGSKPNSSASRIERLRVALKAVTNKKKLDKQLEKLERYRAEFHQQFTHLHWNNLVKDIESLKTEMKDELSTVLDICRKLDKVNSDTQSLSQTALRASFGDTILSDLQHASQLSNEMCVRIWQRRVLSRLARKEANTRLKEVWQAHPKTFEWIFDDSAIVDNRVRRDHVAGSCSFTEWLSTGKGVFHVVGKLASGKSMLMKFLHNHERTRRELEMWARRENKELVIASFFFWSQGTPIQRSLDGLRRTLLCDILQARPDLIPVVLPAAWKEIQSEPWQIHDTGDIDDAMARAGFGKIMGLKEIYDNHRFCIFVDGLDEQDGESGPEDHRDLVELLKDWAESSEHLKLCVSSRDYNVFQEGFRDVPGFLLQSLTQNDMDIYIRDRLAQIQELDDEDKTELGRTILDRAEGVFLWVHLVLTYLRNNCSGRSFDEMKRNVDQLPRQLKALMRRVFDKIPEADSREAYLTFKMVLLLQDGEIRLSLLSWSYLTDYLKNESFSLGEAFPSGGDRHSLPRRVEKAHSRLNDICRGLVVEVMARDHVGRNLVQQHLVGRRIPIPLDKSAGFEDYLVLAYTHRSVPEFLEEQQQLASLDEKVCINAVSTLQVAELREFRLTPDPDLEYDEGIVSAFVVNIMNIRVNHHLDTDAPYRILEVLRGIFQAGDDVVLTRCSDWDHYQLYYASGGVSMVQRRDRTMPTLVTAPVFSPLILSCALESFAYPLWYMQQSSLGSHDSRHKDLEFTISVLLQLSVYRAISGDPTALELLEELLQQARLATQTTPTVSSKAEYWRPNNWTLFLASFIKIIGAGVHV